jgi:hypothetical protein
MQRFGVSPRKLLSGITKIPDLIYGEQQDFQFLSALLFFQYPILLLLWISDPALTT